MGKGSGRRPAQVDRATEQANWDRIFPPKKREKWVPRPLSDPPETSPPEPTACLRAIEFDLGDGRTSPASHGSCRRGSEAE